MKISAAISSLLLAGAIVAEAKVCGNGYYGENGHYYEIVQNAKSDITWHKARGVAQTMSHCGVRGHLATIGSQEENDYVVGLLMDGKCGTEHDAWIGLHDIDKDDNFEWVNNEAFTWQNWCPGQPDTSTSGDEDFGEVWIDGKNNGCWNENHPGLNGGKYVVEYDCEQKPDSGGDPHFRTWSESHFFMFHGGCDLVLINIPEFANGLGLTIHIRTKILSTWSHIQAAVLQIGDNTLEISASAPNDVDNANGSLYTPQVRFNGEKEGHQMETKEATLGDYMVKFTRDDDTTGIARVNLGNDNAISFDIYKRFLRVNIGAHSPHDFAGSVGILGSYPSGEMHARDGVSIIEDSDEFGQEWRVLVGEKRLFHDADSVPAQLTCPMPNKSKRVAAHRRLSESGLAITEEDAAQACARVRQEDRDACIFDVLATNDPDTAGAY